MTMELAAGCPGQGRRRLFCGTYAQHTGRAALLRDPGTRERFKDKSNLNGTYAVDPGIQSERRIARTANNGEKNFAN